MAKNVMQREWKGEQVSGCPFLLLVLLLMMFAAPDPARAQRMTSLTGMVLDPQGNVVPEAVVTLTKPTSGSTWQTVSDSKGRFDFTALAAGVYQLSASASGFEDATREIAVRADQSASEALQFTKVVSRQSVTVVGSLPDVMAPDPSQRTFTAEDLLEANPGRPGVPLSVPGLPTETASGGIKAPQYFAPGVAGDHGEPIAQFFQVGNFLIPNNLPANAHGSGYADPNVLVPNGISAVSADSGAFNVREGNNAVDAGVAYSLRDRVQSFTQVTFDAHDVNLTAGWSPQNPQTLGWIALQSSFGNGFLERPEDRRQYKVNGYRAVEAGHHQFTFFGDGYYGFSFIPGLIPVDDSVPGDTIDPRQQEKTHNSLLVATDTWQFAAKSQFQLSGFFRTYSLDLRSNFGGGLIRQSEFRTVSGANVSYVFVAGHNFSFLAGMDIRRDAPRNLNLAHAASNGSFLPVTSNDLTMAFVAPFLSIDGTLTSHIHYDLGVRREEVSIGNTDKIFPMNSFDKLAGITLPKGTITILPSYSRILPRVSFSLGEAFHTNDPRIGTGTALPTLIAPSNSMRLVLTKDICHTDFGLSLSRVANSEELSKIDPDTGLQQDVGPSLVRSIAVSARHYFSLGSLQASWARATATNRVTGQNIPEAPRLIWSITGTINRLPLGLRLASEYETIGRKPLGDGFTALPVREFRYSLARSFHEGRVDLALNSLLASGYTGQTLEKLPLPAASAVTVQPVGVRLKSFVGVSLNYTFRR